jgi:hypothetical protein
MFEQLDESKDADLAAFSAGAGFSLLRVGVGVCVGLGWLLGLPALLMELTHLLALLSFPLGWLIGLVLLSRSARGRGALWAYGQGRSPSQSLRVAMIFTLLAALATLLRWSIHQR